MKPSRLGGDRCVLNHCGISSATQEKRHWNGGQPAKGWHQLLSLARLRPTATTLHSCMWEAMAWHGMLFLGANSTVHVGRPCSTSSQTIRRPPQPRGQISGTPSEATPIQGGRRPYPSCRQVSSASSLWTSCLPASDNETEGWPK